MKKNPHSKTAQRNSNNQCTVIKVLKEINSNENKMYMNIMQHQIQDYNLVIKD